MDKTTSSNFPVIALIVAAGRGSRLDSDIPKQYLKLAGKPILRHTLKTFIDHPAIDAVRVIIHADDYDLYEEATYGLPLLPPCIGGKRRQDSVRLGLDSLEEHSPEKVLIHDAARPFVTPRIITQVIEELSQQKAAIPVLPITDTIKRIQGTVIESTVDRNHLYLAQTPQGFTFSDILSAHEQMKEQDFTDDASICEAGDIEVTVIPGSTKNVKITTRKDLQRAESLLMSHTAIETRTGSGFDVHRFKEADNPENNHIMLCGIAIPHDKSIEAHSDGDVGLHAIVDALLGTIGAGDIGTHFPPSDPKWQNVDSSAFVKHAAALVSEASGRIVNIDVTLICERPKVGQFREAMRRRISDILAISSERVSIKATTTEKLGFTGRKEGIAAQAIANIALPLRHI